MPRHSGQHGVSLVEIMVTLAILAILLMVAMPSYTAFIEKRRITSAAEVVLADVRWARSEAIKRNTRVRIAFTVGTAGNWSYSVLADTDNDNDFSDEASIKTVNGTEFPTVELDEANFSGNAVTTFDPIRGTAGAGSVFLSSSQHNARITVSVLGRSRICGLAGYEACPS